MGTEGPGGQRRGRLRRGRRAIAALAGVALLGLGPAASAGTTPAIRSADVAGPADCVVPHVDDRCETWRRDVTAPSTRYWTPLIDLLAVPGGDRAYAVVVMPTGHRLVTSGPDGEVLSDAPLRLPRDSRVQQVALARGGETLYIAFTVPSYVDDLVRRFEVAAVATGDGSTRWSFSDPRSNSGGVEEIAVSGDGRTLVASGGWKYGDVWRQRFLALDSVTGSPRWDVGVGGIGTFALAVNEDASTIVAVGAATSPSSTAWDRVTDSVAFGFTAGGELRWKHRLASAHGGEGWFSGLVVSGDTAYVTGRYPTGPGANDAPCSWAQSSVLPECAMVGVVEALDLADGEARWSTTTEPAAYGHTELTPPVVSPDGKRVYVGGTATELLADPYDSCCYEEEQDQDMLALALDAASGQVQWSTRTGTPHSFERGESLALSPDGSRLYQAGYRADIYWSYVYARVGDVTTVAHDARTGQRLWTARARGDVDTHGFPRGIVVLDGGNRVVTGAVEGRETAVTYSHTWVPLTYDRRAVLLGYPA